MKHINGDTQMTDVWRLPAIAPWETSPSTIAAALKTLHS